jgi:predicted DNA-binding transcriptional regulator AlpA
MKRPSPQAAERIGLKGKTFDNWRAKNCGPPYYKVGGRVVYDDDEVDAWLASRRRTSTSDPGPSRQAAAP